MSQVVNGEKILSVMPRYNLPFSVILGQKSRFWSAMRYRGIQLCSLIRRPLRDLTRRSDKYQRELPSSSL
jgi:hypothetical protein